nr:hypothetical protein Ccrd_003297 [Ipomoea trifida]
MTFIASLPNTISSNNCRSLSSRGTVASKMSNKEEKWKSASRNRVTKNGVLYVPFTTPWMNTSGLIFLIRSNTMSLGLFGTTVSSGTLPSRSRQFTTNTSSLSISRRRPVAFTLSAGRNPGWGKSIPVIRSLGGPPGLVERP